MWTFLGPTYGFIVVIFHVWKVHYIHYSNKKNTTRFSTSWWFQHIFLSFSPPTNGEFFPFWRIFFWGMGWFNHQCHVWGLGGQRGANARREDGNGTTESGLGRWGSSILPIFFVGGFFVRCIFWILKRTFGNVKIIQIFWWWRFFPLKMDVDL